MKKRKKLNKGFTLIEVILVIAILAVLASIALPGLTGYTEKAKETADIQTVDNLMTAIAAVSILPGHSLPPDAELVVRWDTSKSRRGPGTGEGGLTVELRGGVHSSGDSAWIESFEKKLYEVMEVEELGLPKSARASKDDLLLKYNVDTGEMILHQLYKYLWIDEMDLNIAYGNF